jgi:hypothetical protein
MMNTLKPQVDPICQLGEDVAVAAGALRYQNVRSIESVEEVDQLQLSPPIFRHACLSARSISARSAEVT